MRDSISRKALVIAAAAAAPLLLIVFVWVPSLQVRMLSAVVALSGLLVVWLVSHAFARRINGLAGFVDGILDRGADANRLQTSDDELGSLARSLSRMAPRIAELVSRLSLELTRREAVLASMTEAVLAVDAQLNVTFCNHSFQQAVGGHHTAEGVPLIRIVRDPGLFRVLKQVVDSGETLRERLQLSATEARTFEVCAWRHARPPSNRRRRSPTALLAAPSRSYMT